LTPLPPIEIAHLEFKVTTELVVSVDPRIEVVEAFSVEFAELEVNEVEEDVKGSEVAETHPATTRLNAIR